MRKVEIGSKQKLKYPELVFRCFIELQLAANWDRPRCSRSSFYCRGGGGSQLFSAPSWSNFRANRRADERPFFWHML